MAAIASLSTEKDIEDASEVVKSKPSAMRAAQDDGEEEKSPSGGIGERAGSATKDANGDVPTFDTVNLNHPRSNSDSEGSGSATALLREKPGRGEGETADSRLESLRLSSRTDFTLTDTFKVGGRICTVTLEEDRISWAPKKSSGKETLFLSDIFAVIPGPMAPPPQSRGPRRLSTSTDTCYEFTIHALKSVINSPGVLTKLTFRSTRSTSTSDACQVWSQQLKHQLQNFGNRPRRLYVVVNPVSGEGSALKTWNRVEALFQLTHITTETMCCNTPMDVTSVSHNGQLVTFAAGMMAYGFWSDMSLFSQDFSWLGSHRYGAAIIRTLLSHRSFEAEVLYVPVEDPTVVMETRERCFSRCTKCANFDSGLDSPTATSNKGASVLATYSEEDTVDQKHWKKITGHFSNIMVCPHACSTQYAPHGFSPYAHVGNGCADLVLLNRCSKLGHARWLMRQKKSRDMFDLPYVQIQRVKEFKFREILGRSRSFSEPREVERSVENLVQDDDEATNRRAGARRSIREREEGRDRGGGGGGGRDGGFIAPSSRWNIDGNEIGHSDIEVRVHRHLITMLARGVEPGSTDSTQGEEHRTEQRVAVI